MPRPDALLERGRDHPQHSVPDIIAMAIVDRLEAVELERKDDQRMAAFRGGAAQLLALVGKALAVEQAGHSVRGGDDRGPRFALLAHFGLVLQVDIAPPAEQDERDIERQRDRRDLQAGPKAVPREGQALEEFAAVPDEHDHGRDEDAKHQHVPPRISE